MDRSPEIARRLVDLWLEDPKLPDDAVFGARSQIVLPSKLRPDISVEVSGRALQLLIEVKVGAPFAEHDGLSQDEAYRAEWAELNDREAQVRAVGTLTRDASERLDRVDPRQLRARDVEWSELKWTLRDVADQRSIEPVLEAVVRSFCDAIDLHLEEVVVDEAALPAFFERARPVVAEIGTMLGERLAAAPSISDGAHYAGAKLSYTGVDGGSVVIRVIGGAPGGAMTPVGAEPTLLVGVGRDHSILLKGDDRTRGLGAGFELIKTPQFTFTGLQVPLETAGRELATTADRVVSALIAASMLPAGPDIALPQAVGDALELDYKGKLNLPAGYGQDDEQSSSA